jgi:Skp family chaperone for outer membrane proteins
MKIHRLLVAAVFVAAIVSTAFAQPKPSAPATQPAAPQTSTGTVPESKIAVIYSSAFLDPKTGIAKFTTLVNTLTKEFGPRQTELTTLQQRLTQTQDELKKLQGSSVPVDPKSMQAKADSLEQLKKEYQRKGEDAEALYQKRQQEIFAPLQDDIEKALEAYAKQRGITVIIDASRVPMVYAADSIDITRAFITDFNSKNPATASVTPPK